MTSIIYIGCFQHSMIHGMLPLRSGEHSSRRKVRRASSFQRYHRYTHSKANQL
uniref:Uncharacterized protein n=1 Tax=Arundo donax TaxID=35708 RepID=A0A0A8Z534_ARUDO